MTREETIKLLTVLKTSYPRFYTNLSKIDAENIINLWSVMFAEDEAKAVEIALYKLIATSPYPPSIADLRKTIAEITTPVNLDSSEAWGEVMKAIRIYGYINEEGALKSMSPLTAEIVRRMGWQTICQSENVVADRAHFLKIYELSKSQTVEKNCIPNNINRKILELSENLNMQRIEKECMYE